MKPKHMEMDTARQGPMGTSSFKQRTACLFASFTVPKFSVLTTPEPSSSSSSSTSTAKQNHRRRGKSSSEKKMWKRNVNLIKTALKTSPQNQASLTSTSLLLLRQWQRQPTRHFSTQQQQELPNKDPTAASIDPFLRTPSTGLVYGRLSGITNHTTKIDVVMLLEGRDLTPDDIKVDYNRSYVPLGMLIQFPSPNAYDAAIRTIIRKGRVYKLDKANRSEWEVKEPYDGKAILLQGIPRNALVDDVERFLSGCQYDATSLQLVTRQAFPDPIRMAVVRFPSKAQAMHAYLTKNRGFCLNNQILARVLH